MKRYFRGYRVGLLVGTGAGLILLLWLLVSSARGPLLPTCNTHNVLFFLISMGFPAIIGGAVSGSIIEHWVRSYVLCNKYLAEHKVGVVAGCVIGGLFLFPMGAFLGVVFGGVWGGAIGDAFGSRTGTRELFIPIGIGLGVFLVIQLVTVLGSTIIGGAGLVIDTTVRKLLRITS